MVVCNPDIIVISVKDITLGDTGNLTLDWGRWTKKAIDASCKQIYGAERWIGSATKVICKDGSHGLDFPEFSVRRIHRIAVHLGGKDEVPFPGIHLDKQLIHVFDSKSFEIILDELDTITDFIEYLLAEEKFLEGDKKIVINGGEENLLAFYLQQDKSYPMEPNLILIDDDLWDGWKNSQEYRMKKEADKVSYIWDGIIEELSTNFFGKDHEFGSTLNEMEHVTRILAREKRFYRRLLGMAFEELLRRSKQPMARLVQSPSGILYVFLTSPRDIDSKARRAELANRCFVVRGLHPDHKTVVGISTEVHQKNQGHSLDACLLYINNWTKEDEQQFKDLRQKFKYFIQPTKTKYSIDEYPSKN